MGATVEITHHDIHDGVVRLAVAGEIDLATADQLRDAIAQAAAGSRTEVIVDLAEVRFCDSTGIGAIVQARNAAASEGATVQVINPRGPVYRVLEVTGMLDSLTDPP